MLKLKLSYYTPWRRLGERKYSSYSFLTSTLDGVSDQRHAPAALLAPGERTAIPIGRKAWAPELVWTQRLEEKSFTSAGDRTTLIINISAGSYIDVVVSASQTLMALTIVRSEILYTHFCIFVLTNSAQMASMYQYSVPELLCVAAFHTGTYQSVYTRGDHNAAREPREVL
jgi:hypothetical protein